MAVQAQGASVLAGGARLAQRAGGAAGTEDGMALGGDGDGVTGGAGGGASRFVDGEIVPAEPPAAEMGKGLTIAWWPASRRAARASPDP